MAHESNGVFQTKNHKLNQLIINKISLEKSDTIFYNKAINFINFSQQEVKIRRKIIWQKS